MLSPKSKEKCPDILYIWLVNADRRPLFQTLEKCSKMSKNVCTKLVLHVFTGVEIRKKVLTGHKFTNLLKSIWWPWFTPRGKFCLFSLPDRWKMAFPHLKRKKKLKLHGPFLWMRFNCLKARATSRRQLAFSSCKNIKMKLTLLKKYQKLFTSHIFFFVSTAILSSNNNILTVSEIQTMRKINNPTTNPFAGLFLIVVKFNLLEW